MRLLMLLSGSLLIFESTAWGFQASGSAYEGFCFLEALPNASDEAASYCESQGHQVAQLVRWEGHCAHWLLFPNVTATIEYECVSPEQAKYANPFAQYCAENAPRPASDRHPITPDGPAVSELLQGFAGLRLLQ